MRAVIVSDTHNKLDRMSIPDGDMLIHCGDFTFRGDMRQVDKFNRDMGRLPHRRKLAIAGNHDFPLELDNAEARARLTNVLYLQDELVVIDGLRIYGSPFQPEHRKLAFNLPRSSEQLRAKWQQIPDRVDILITHGPPKGILDRTPDRLSVGCELLLERVLEVRPKIHCFGHVHLSRGQVEQDGIIFVNAACVNERYQPSRKPIAVLDI